MSDIKSKSWIKNQVDMIFEEVKTATPNQRDSIPYRRKLANKYQTFFEKFPSLLMSIIDQGEDFDMKRLNEMLNLMTDIHSGEKKMEDAEYIELITALESELIELKDSLEEKQTVIDAYEEEKKKALIAQIQKFSVYKDEELADSCVRELEIIKDAVIRFQPKDGKSTKLPRGTQKVADASDEPRMRGDSVFAEIQEGFS